MVSDLIKPLEDRVVVRAVAVESITDGGLHIPEGAKERPLRGEVVSVGPGRADMTIGSQVKLGDTVLYGKFAGQEIVVDGENYLIMRESDIFAVVHDG